jgi:hypothetical protein
MGPWDPNWRPDPTGARLIAIRAARRGALAAALFFGGLVFVAGLVSTPASGGKPDEVVIGAAVIALFSLPGVALLGAGLTSAALGTPSSAVSAGVAIGIGAPVAAVTSAMIGAFILVGWASGLGDGADVAGTLLRAGVIAALRIAPLIALASIVWVLFVRRLARRG